MKNQMFWLNNKPFIKSEFFLSNMVNKLKVHSKEGTFEQEIELGGKRSLLDDMLDNGVNVFFGCMGGSCSACKCKITKGLDKIDKEAMGPQRFKDVKEDEILSCISKVKDDVDDETIELEKVL